MKMFRAVFLSNLSLSKIVNSEACLSLEHFSRIIMRSSWRFSDSFKSSKTTWNTIRLLNFQSFKHSWTLCHQKQPIFSKFFDRFHTTSKSLGRVLFKMVENGVIEIREAILLISNHLKWNPSLPCISPTQIWTLLSIIISRKCWICINKSWLNLASSCLWSICSKSNFSKSGFGIGWQIFLESHGNTSVKPRTKSSLTLEKLHSFKLLFIFSQESHPSY